jgi:hypothetical protein
MKRYSITFLSWATRVLFSVIFYFMAGILVYLDIPIKESRFARVRVAPVP